jgi:hypothetical protein
MTIDSVPFQRIDHLVEPGASHAFGSRGRGARRGPDRSAAIAPTCSPATWKQPPSLAGAELTEVRSGLFVILKILNRFRHFWRRFREAASDGPCYRRGRLHRAPI